MVADAEIAAAPNGVAALDGGRVVALGLPDEGGGVNDAATVGDGQRISVAAVADVDVDVVTPNRAGTGNGDTVATTTNVAM